MRNHENFNGSFNGSTDTALGILVHLSETTGRIEAKQTHIMQDVRQTKAEVHKIDRRLRSVEQGRKLNLKDVAPYIYGSIVLILAALGKLDLQKALELLK